MLISPAWCVRKYWTLLQFFNLQYVPRQYRVLFGNIVAFFWTIYLSLETLYWEGISGRNMIYGEKCNGCWPLPSVWVFDDWTFLRSALHQCVCVHWAKIRKHVKSASHWLYFLLCLRGIWIGGVGSVFSTQLWQGWKYSQFRRFHIRQHHRPK